MSTKLDSEIESLEEELKTKEAKKAQLFAKKEATSYKSKNEEEILAIPVINEHTTSFLKDTTPTAVNQLTTNARKNSKKFAEAVAEDE